jgi:ABC-2 type transport system permease protein
LDTQPVQTQSQATWNTGFKRDWFILKQLVTKDFKLKYRRSFLGVAWSVLNPLLMMVVMAAVFSNFIRAGSDGVPNYPLYLILGNVTFTLMSDSTSRGMSSIIDAASLLKKVRINRYVFPVQKVLFACVNFGFSLIAVALVMLFYRIPLSWNVVFLPLFLVYLCVFCIGLSLLLSAVSVFFRDVMHLWSVVLTAWTYLTPIFYTVDILPAFMQTFMKFNPMYHYITYIREILLYQATPSLMQNLVCIACALVMLAVGWLVFRKTEHKFILYI